MRSLVAEKKKAPPSPNGVCGANLTSRPRTPRRVAARTAACLEDVDQFRLPNCAGRDREGQIGEFVFIKRWLPVIHQQERNRRVGSGPLVAIDKRAVLAEMKQVGSRHRGHGSMQELSVERRLRCGNRRFEGSSVANARRTTISFDLLFMDFENFVQ